LAEDQEAVLAALAEAVLAVAVPVEAGSEKTKELSKSEIN
jgi:hypothetical protein